MATSCNQEDKIKTSTTESEASTEENENTGAEKAPGESNEGISIFCKACLHPYSGEKKSGSLVLKCERCGQTDVITEDEASDLNPEEWVGNLMMNRFLQVLKEQEDLCLNITDPFFAEDEYKKLHMAISEYTFNMKAVAERMYDIASSAVSSLANYYEKKKDRLRSINTGEAEPEMETVSETGRRQEVVYVLPEAVRRHLKNLGPTVLSLMEDLVKKYELPLEILGNVKERVKHIQTGPALVEAARGSVEHSSANGASCKECLRNISEVSEINGSSNNEEKDNQSETQDEAKTEVSEGAEAAGNVDDGDVSEENEKTDNDENAEGDDEDKTNGDYMIFNISKSTLEKEVFAALKHKFALKFDSDTKTEPRTEEGAEGASAKAANGESENGGGHVADTDIDSAETVIRSVEGLRTYVLETTADDPASVTDNNKENKDDKRDELEVNFYAVSSAFISELQERKNRALMERKDKALKTVNQKIKFLKKEMERVEDRVRDELTSAYERKRKKVETQRRQLDDRHKQIQEAERLLDYYARTGQREKLTELMEKLNVQYEN